MEKRAEQKRNYLIINGEKIPISKEIEQEILRGISDVRNKARREKTCRQNEFQKCRGDCAFCPWHQKGILLSFDDPTDFIPANALASDDDVEGDALWKLTLKKMYAFANSKVPNGAVLLEKRFVEQMTLRNIASEMGLQLTVVARRLNRLILLIQENKDLFF